MNGRELKEQLDQLLADRPELAELEVCTEGCDCIGPASSFRVAAYTPWGGGEAKDVLILGRAELDVDKEDFDDEDTPTVPPPTAA